MQAVKQESFVHMLYYYYCIIIGSSLQGFCNYYYFLVFSVYFYS